MFYTKRNYSNNKFNAKRVEYDGIKFDSLAECEFYKLLKLDKNVVHIDCHVPVTLPGGIRLNIDFIVYKVERDKHLVEAYEVKGVEQQSFKRLRKQFDQIHPLAPLKVFKYIYSSKKWVNL